MKKKVDKGKRLIAAPSRRGYLFVPRVFEGCQSASSDPTRAFACKEQGVQEVCSQLQKQEIH